MNHLRLVEQARGATRQTNIDECGRNAAPPASSLTFVATGTEPDDRSPGAPCSLPRIRMRRLGPGGRSSLWAVIIVVCGKLVSGPVGFRFELLLTYLYSTSEP